MLFHLLSSNDCLYERKYKKQKVLHMLEQLRFFETLTFKKVNANSFGGTEQRK
jgi:hypothetical protein